MAKDQGALIRNYSKWDDEPRSVPAAVETMLRAYQIASDTTIWADLCLSRRLPSSSQLKVQIAFPDIARFRPGLSPAPAGAVVEEAGAAARLG